MIRGNIFTAGGLDKQQTECTPLKCFRCRSLYRLIAKCPKPPKDKQKQRKKFRFNEMVNCESQKESENGDNYNTLKIYASMACMSGNDESSSRYFDDSSQLTNCILDSVVM